ncbi:MAG: ketoacyl-ACP synthase III [Oscillospiraceae bacterium]|jgi:3-oxoacyl-[acyl-carrier-protein] synthase-3|nr:ketoacyl-ACP synthase III [Oscillospiraceae bacterium]
MTLKITGTGKGIPQKSVSNDELSKFLDTSDEWITTRTGIKSRHICTHETLTDLCAEAAMQAIGKAGISTCEVDLIICSTIAGDFRTPSLACCVAERIGASCPAFDINAACTGFIYSLEVASSLLASGKYGSILIICAEKMSAHLDWTQRDTCVLFGDGASACVVANGNALRYLNIRATPDVSMLYAANGVGNSPYDTTGARKGYVKMRGQDVFRFAVNAAETEISGAMAALGITAEQIDTIILHQANKRIIEATIAKLGQPKERFPMNIDRYGNISSVSIPLMLHDMLECGMIKRGETLFMAAFGAGLTAGSCVMVWE